MAHPFLLRVCDSTEQKDTVCPTRKGCCFTSCNGLFSFFPSFQGTVLQGFDPTPEEPCCCFQRLKEEAAWALPTIAEVRLTG